MKAVFRSLVLVLSFIANILLVLTPAQARDDDELTLVGRISHVEGKLLRYIEEENDWVITVKDAPFGLKDALYSGDYAKAEFMLPNRTWLRVGEDTQVQLIDLNPEATTLDVASGLTRLYNKSQDVVIKVTTPFGYVVAPGETVFDLYVGDSSLEVIAVDGDVDFVHYGSNSRYEVLEGYSSIIADDRDVMSGNGTVDAVWDDWNRERDELWETRLRRSAYSAGFLPESIREDSYYLEENGQWERIYYEGAYWDMWRPNRVERGWRPFTAGRWTVYYGDHCWVPDEPFGYVTHHYGTWVYVEPHRSWFWMPPVARLIPDRSRFFVRFGWHPGRVGWIHSGRTIGWVPLAWDEEYYGHRRWGHRTVVVRPQTVININIYRYRFLDEAVVIPRDHFYRGTRYTEVVRRDVGRDVIINNYQPVTVINNTVINNFNIDKRRFAYNDVKVDRKPHVTVVNRINANQRDIKETERTGRDRIKRDLTRFDVRSEPPPAKADVPKPALTPKLVEPDKVSRPIKALDLEKKEIKPRERERRLAAGDEQRRSDRGRQDRDRDSDRKEAKGEAGTAMEPELALPQQGESTPQGREQQQLESGERNRPIEREIGQQQEETRGRRGPRPPGELQQGDTEGPQQLREPGQAQQPEEQPRLRSPRDNRDRDQRPRPQENLGQPEAGPSQPEQEIGRQQPEETRGRRGPRPPGELRQGDTEGPQQLREPGQAQQPEEQPWLRSPRDKGDRDQRPRPQEKLEQPEAGPRQPEQEIGRPQPEEARGRRGQPRQDQVEQRAAEQGQTQEIQEQPRVRSPRQKAGQEENQQRDEVRQRQDEEDRQQQLAAQAARQEKEEENVRQQELVRQQKENQLRDQRRQEQEAQQRQKQEARKRQAEEDRQQQLAAQAARQKKEEESARQQELARQQKENQLRDQRRQEQEAQHRQKKEQVRQQEQTKKQEQDRQQEQIQAEDEKPRQEKKKRKQQEEEQQ